MPRLTIKNQRALVKPSVQRFRRRNRGYPWPRSRRDGNFFLTTASSCSIISITACFRYVISNLLFKITLDLRTMVKESERFAVTVSFSM